MPTTDSEDSAIAAAAMTGDSRMPENGYKIPAAGQVQPEPQVETPQTRTGAGQAGDAPATDPVCGMTVDPATASASRSTSTGTVYFCSAGCAAAYDTDPGLHAAAAAAAPGTRTR